MIDVYSWPTPNGHKVHIMLEECGLPWRVHAVNIGKGDQFEADFLAISPNNKIPAIVDPDGPDGAPISVFESGAVLLYLAGKTGRFLPADVRGKYEALQWLMFQMGGVGPMTLPRFHVHQVMQPNERSPRSLGAGSRWPSAGAGGCTSPRSNRLCPAWPALACRSVPDGCARPSAS